MKPRQQSNWQQHMVTYNRRHYYIQARPITCLDRTEPADKLVKGPVFGTELRIYLTGSL